MCQTDLTEREPLFPVRRPVAHCQADDGGVGERRLLARVGAEVGPGLELPGLGVKKRTFEFELCDPKPLMRECCVRVVRF